MPEWRWVHLRAHKLVHSSAIPACPAGIGPPHLRVYLQRFPKSPRFSRSSRAKLGCAAKNRWAVFWPPKKSQKKNSDFVFSLSAKSVRIESPREISTRGSSAVYGEVRAISRSERNNLKHRSRVRACAFAYIFLHDIDTSTYTHKYTRTNACVYIFSASALGPCKTHR